jgi:hypothetical protein
VTDPSFVSTGTPPTAPTVISSTAPTAITTSTDEVSIDTITGDDDTYTSSLMTSIQDWIMRSIRVGSVGLSEAVEDAIFARENERALLVQKDLEDSIAAEWSSRGWPMPNGALAAALTQAKINFANRRLDTSRDIEIKSYELAVANTHFVIQQGIAVEAHMVAWANWVAERLYNIAKSNVGFQIESFKANMENEINKIRNYEVAMKAYELDVRRYEANINRYSSEINGFTSLIRYDAEKYALTLNAIKARIEQSVANVGLFIKDKEVTMKHYEMIKSLLVDIEKIASSVHASVIGSSLSAARVSADVHASNTTNYGYKAPASLLESVEGY